MIAFYRVRDLMGRETWETRVLADLDLAKEGESPEDDWEELRR